MIIDLSDKTAIVTGSTGGIGLAIATGLANAGAQVVVVGRDQTRIDTALAQINKAAGRNGATGVAADVGTAQGCDTLISQQPEADILVNGLGIYGAREFFDIDDELWNTFYQVNVMSGVRLARHYAKGMRERGWGRIQFISSESALNIPTEMVHYGVSKSALDPAAQVCQPGRSGQLVRVCGFASGQRHHWSGSKSGRRHRGEHCVKNSA